MTAKAPQQLRSPSAGPHRLSSIRDLDVRLGEGFDDAAEWDAAHRAAGLFLAPAVDACHAEHVILRGKERKATATKEQR